MQFNLVDRIVEVDPGKRLRAVKNLTLGEEYLADHFPTFPVMPGVLMLQTLVESASWLLRLSEEQVRSLQERAPGLVDAYPLTPLQEGMLFHTLAEAEQGAYANQFVQELGDEVDLGLLERSWRELVSRHEVLRTAVLWEGLPEAVQAVARAVPFALERVDWSGLGEAEREAAFARLLEADRERGFELGRAPLMRVTLVELGENRQRVLWSMHHVLLDGWSVALVLDELSRIYRGLGEGRMPGGRARRPFREYVAWLRRRPKELLQHHLLEWKSVADSVLNRMTPAARERLLRDLVDADPVLFLKLATPVIDRLPFSDEASTSAP